MERLFSLNEIMNYNANVTGGKLLCIWTILRSVLLMTFHVRTLL